MSDRPHLLAAGGSHQGLLRDQNEDRWLVDAPRGVFCVVDGVGGHPGGERASGDRRRDAQGPPVARDGNSRGAPSRGHRAREQRDPRRDGGGRVARRHDVRADGGAGRRGAPHGRTRRRLADLQGPARRDREAHTGPLPGRRTGRRRRTQRSGGDAPPASQRGLPGRRCGTPRSRGRGVHRHRRSAVRGRCGAGAVQRRSQRSGAERVDQANGRSGRRATWGRGRRP